MLVLIAYLAGLATLTAAALGGWAVSVVRRNVDIADSLWPLLFGLAACTYCVAAPAPVKPRALLALGLTVIWALRLCVYITWRNWGHHEDRRYRAIRARNQPNFAFKSLYLVFGLQAALAWVISLPLLAAGLSDQPLSFADAAGVSLWAIGMVFEGVGDWQLARFKAEPAHGGRVMDKGLWRWTRHPNYFGEFCIWWGLFLVALGAGAWWSVISPLLMSYLLLRVSGVSLLEADITERRPQYAEYVRRTQAFFPGPPKP